MYELHTISAQVKIDILVKEVVDLKRMLSAIDLYFEENKDLIPNDSSLKLIKKGKGKKVSYPSSNRYLYYNIQIQQYNVLYARLQPKEQELEVLRSYKIPLRIFAFILRRFNELLIQEILYNSYRLKDNVIGHIYLIVNKSKKANINWGISIKNKQTILDKGGIPFIAEEAEKIGSEYKGEKWIEFLPEYRMFYNWKTVASNKIKLPNITNFSFQPLRGINSAVSMLGDIEKTLSQEELISIYKIQNHANELCID
jgi:hypothetical protein